MPILQDTNYQDFTGKYAQSRDAIAFFAGAGLSRPLFPAWREVLSGLLKLCLDKGSLAYDVKELQTLIASGEDYLDIAETLVDALSPSTFRSFMEETFDKDIDKSAISPAYQTLCSLNPRLILTTNYDRVPNVLIPQYRVFTHKQASEAQDRIGSGKYTVFKLHGDIQDQDSIVLTREQYLRVIHENEPVQNLLRAVFTNRTVLFIGFSLTDPNLALVLSGLKAIYQNSSLSHYALMAHMSSFRANAFERAYGVRVIRYKPSDPSHPEVQDFLTSLANGGSGASLSKSLPLDDGELKARLKKYERFDPRGIVHVSSSNDDRILEYKNCLLEASGECFISGTSMIHVAEDSKDLIQRKILESGCSFRLLIMDPLWIARNSELLTFLPNPGSRANFHFEIENSIVKLLDLRDSLPDQFRGRLLVKKYKTFFPYIVTGFEESGDGRLVVEITDYLPERKRLRFTLHSTGSAESLFGQVKAKFDSLWNNPVLTEDIAR